MKTIVGFALLICVATAVGKPAMPQDLPKCLQGAWYEFAAKNEACSNKILEIFRNRKVHVLYVIDTLRVDPHKCNPPMQGQ